MDPVIVACGVVILVGAYWWKQTQSPEPPENVDGLAVEEE